MEQITIEHNGVTELLNFGKFKDLTELRDYVIKKKGIDTSKFCPRCMRLVDLEYDISKKSSIGKTICTDCIRKSHNLMGLEGEGFGFDGNNLLFYSQTTGVMTCFLEDIGSLVVNSFGNSVFPYCIMVYDGCRHVGTFSITREFGKFLMDIGYDIDDWN